MNNIASDVLFSKQHPEYKKDILDMLLYDDDELFDFLYSKKDDNCYFVNIQKYINGSALSLRADKQDDNANKLFSLLYRVDDIIQLVYKYKQRNVERENLNSAQKLSNEIARIVFVIKNFPDEEACLMGKIDDDFKKIDGFWSFKYHENIWELTDKCFLELEYKEFCSLINRSLELLENAATLMWRGSLMCKELKAQHPADTDVELLQEKGKSLNCTLTDLRLFFRAKKEEYVIEPAQPTPTKQNQLTTKLTDTQRGKLFDLLVEGGFIPNKDKEGFIWAFGGVNDKYTTFSTEWLKTKNLAVYLIDILCYDEFASTHFWAIGERIFSNVKGMRSQKQIYLGNGKQNKPDDTDRAKPKAYKLIDTIIEEAQK